MTERVGLIPLQDHIEKVLAGHFSTNRMPDMSGDMRKRLTPPMLRSVQDAARAVIDIVRKTDAQHKEG